MRARMTEQCARTCILQSSDFNGRASCTLAYDKFEVAETTDITKM